MEFLSVIHFDCTFVVSIAIEFITNVIIIRKTSIITIVRMIIVTGASIRTFFIARTEFEARGESTGTLRNAICIVRTSWIFRVSYRFVRTLI